MSETSLSPQYFLKKIKLPKEHSHKGENGKLLIIGGSNLFHAASKWSLDIAARFADMVFYSSVPSNNELLQKAKHEFWDGIVVPRENIEEYINEADVILIGPGMDRSQETETLTNTLLQKYPAKKWVVDAGALQMLAPNLLNKNHILTPHQKELEKLQANGFTIENFPGVLLLKGPTDVVQQEARKVKVTGGNAGMTKGGTGDVLAGLVAALYCRHEALTAAVVGSYINKKAGEKLHQTVGPYFNASDLVATVPATMWEELKKV